MSATVTAICQAQTKDYSSSTLPAPALAAAAVKKPFLTHFYQTYPTSSIVKDGHYIPFTKERETLSAKILLIQDLILFVNSAEVEKLTPLKLRVKAGQWLEGHLKTYYFQESSQVEGFRSELVSKILLMNVIAQKKSDVLDKIEKICKKLFDEQLGSRFSKIVGDFEITEEDCKAANYKFSEVRSIFDKSDRTYNCIDFGLYHMHIEAAYDYLFFHVPFKTPFLDFLSTQGFEQVSEPRPGDLAIYIQSDPSAPNKIRALHFAVVKTKDVMISKWGSAPVVEHHKEFISLVYGYCILCFRKKNRFRVMELFKLQLTKLTNDIKLLTAKGLIDISIELLEGLAKDFESKMLPNSLYGKSCLPKICMIFKSHMERLTKEIEGVAIETILQRIQAKAVLTENEVPLDFSLLGK